MRPRPATAHDTWPGFGTGIRTRSSPGSCCTRVRVHTGWGDRLFAAPISALWS
jgi:hypothetical protein